MFLRPKLQSLSQRNSVKTFFLLFWSSWCVNVWVLVSIWWDFSYSFYFAVLNIRHSLRIKWIDVRIFLISIRRTTSLSQINGCVLGIQNKACTMAKIVFRNDSLHSDGNSAQNESLMLMLLLIMWDLVEEFFSLSRLSSFVSYENI